MIEEKYVCDTCHGVFNKGWSDEEADKESMELHGKTRHTSNMAIVCDDCFRKMRGQGIF